MTMHNDNKEYQGLSFLISGAGGMIGSALCAFLNRRGHQVNRIVRSPEQLKHGDVFFDGSKMHFPDNAKFDCIVNLAGAGIADQSWSEVRKKELVQSRVDFTQKLVAALADLQYRPQTLLSASGLGYYHDNGQQVSNEESPKGNGFLSDLSATWEQAALKAEDSGIRTCLLRFGVVLDPRGGALKKMLPIFRWGLGGPLGKGNQILSWISLEDVLRILALLADDKGQSGIFNLCNNQAIENRQLAKALAAALKRPCLLPVPEAFIRFIFGQMAEETLLSSLTCLPERLNKLGYQFLFPDLRQLFCAVINV